MNGHFCLRDSKDDLKKNPKIKCSRMDLRSTFKHYNQASVGLHDFKSQNFKEAASSGPARGTAQRAENLILIKEPEAYK